MNSGQSLLKPEHERISSLLISTVTMLCKNGIQFSSDLKIQGVIGITVDSDRVFLIELKKWIDVAGNNLLQAESDSLPASVGRSAAGGIKAEPYAAGFHNLSQFSNSGAGDNFGNNASGFGDDGYNDDDEQTEVADDEQPTNTVVEYHEEINYTFPKIKNEPNPSTSAGYQNQQQRSSPGWNRPPNPANQCAQNSSPVRGLPRIRRGQPPRGGTSLRGQRGRGGGARGRPMASPMKRGASHSQVSSPGATPSKVQAQDGSGFTFGKIVQTSYVCNLCGAQLSSHASLLTHQVRIHGRQKKANMGRKPKQPQQYAE